MELHLLKILIEKQLVQTNTEVNAIHKGRHVGGRIMGKFNSVFVIQNWKEDDKGNLQIKVKSTFDGGISNITHDQITNIDGMTPERFAENFMITPEGETIEEVGRRRGRRPKDWVSDDDDDFT